MVLATRSVLYIFTIITAIHDLHSIDTFGYDSSEMPSWLNGQGSRKPLIVVIGRNYQSRSSDEIVQVYSSSIEYEDSNRNYRFDKVKTANNIYDTLLGGKTNDDSNNMLRDGQVDENSEEQIEKEIMIADALRSRCQAIVECEEKCPDDEPKKKPKKKNSCSESNDECDATTEKCSESCETPKPKQEKYCPKSCKAVFDHLINCPPPGNRKKKKENKKKKGCGPATGKTMPPNWKTGSEDECD
ncbi:uncharacterized protein LOC110377680 [Helicoverpa armigera]|uniref:uncharacterized protein LOC110377680 n=1 Tax=Helicoverpa armigera TaxID=29058 RepID=UPI0030833A1E